MMTGRNSIAPIALLALALASSQPASAANLSPELLDWLANGHLLDEQVSIVVQLDESLSERERSALVAPAHNVTEFENLGMLALSIPARELPRWAANAKVRAISFDAQVQAAAAPSFR